MAHGQALFRGDRRRRVLADESRRAAEAKPLPATEGSRYTDAANIENHPQVTQFIPRRYRNYALSLGAAACAITGIQLLHVYSTRMALAIDSGPIRAFDLTAGGGLAGWFAAVMLAALSVVCLAVFGIRRHRVDDYRARYRVWMWTAACALFASIDSVAALHEPWSKLWTRLTGWSALDGHAWWLGPACLLGAWLAWRLVLDLRESKAAVTLFILAVASLVVAAAFRYGIVASGDDLIGRVVASASLLAGHALLLAAVTFYARHVVLDVQGLIGNDARLAETVSQAAPKQQAKQRDRQAAQDTGDKPAPKRTTTLKLQKVRSAKQSEESMAQSEWIDGSQPHEDPYESASGGAKKLSKSQRKRLRKQHRRAA